MLLIITGCIKVNDNTPYVAVRDDRLRLDDYISTIKWAIESEVFDKIVFCDNSGYVYDDKEIQDLAKIRFKKFEWLCFQASPDLVNTYGKGYGEGEIIKYVLNNSKIISDSDYFFCKITGRLRISNIENLLRKDRNCFMKKHYSKEIDTRFYCISIDTYKKYMLNVYKNTYDSQGKYLEHVFYEALKKYKIKYKMFMERPLFLGISGSTGRKYEEIRKKHEIIIDFLCKTNIYNNEILWNIIASCKNKRVTDK